MTLDQYLANNEIPAATFARELGIDPSSLWRLRRGKARPDWKTIDAIVRATRGAVTPNDFLALPPAEARGGSAP
jgi:transcriptional regulator with XRE-family HTH domain